MLFAQIIIAASFLGAAFGAEKEFPCGIAHGSGVSNRVIHGIEVKNGKYPWMVYFGGVECTASIISSRYILTAKHCTHVCLPTCKQTCQGEECGSCIDNCSVMVGEVNTTSPNGQKYNISAYHEHEESDFSIIELAEPLNFTELVRPICLAKRFEENNNSVEATIAGWGAIKYTEDCEPVSPPPEALTDVLREGTARMVDFDECRKLGALQPYEVCAKGTKGTGSFHGDSGGPLMVQSDGKQQWTQIGVTYRGMQCYSPEETDYKEIVSYSRVSYHCDWIAKITNNEAKCTIDL